MIIFVLIVLGLCLGSFINALVWRMHEQERLKHKKNLNKSDKSLISRLSIAKGRSMCPSCSHELVAKDLIPIVSWGALRGRCRYCHGSISVQYPIVELGCALLFVGSYIWWPESLRGLQVAIFALWLLILPGLIALAIYDLKWTLLPNRIIYPLSYLATIVGTLTIIDSHNYGKAILNLICAVLVGGGIFYILFQVSKGRWIGGGDVRLGALLGLIVATPAKSVLFIFLASLLGSATSVPLLASHKLKRNSSIPFGPFLIIAAIIVELLGHFILSWYQNTFFPYGV